jgi:hypothetical protein
MDIELTNAIEVLNYIMQQNGITSITIGDGDDSDLQIVEVITHEGTFYSGNNHDTWNHFRSPALPEDEDDVRHVDW